MIGKLKRVIKKKSLKTVAKDLGYKSPSTIHYWLNNKKVPSYMKSTVKSYLEAN